MDGEASIASGPPLAAVDAALAGLKAAPVAPAGAPGRPLGPGLALQFRGGAGVLAEVGGDGDAILLALRDKGASPWFSLEVELPVAALVAARFFGLRLGGASEAGVLTLRPVLRLFTEDGWRDLSFAQEAPFTPEEGESLLLLALEDAMEGVGRAVLILFFQQGAGALRLTRLDPFCAA